MKTGHVMLLAGLTVCLLAGIAGAAELLLDGFEYADAVAAGQIWEPQEGSPPVQVEPHADGMALKMFGNFSQNDRRVVYDRNVKWDLSRWTRFSIDIAMPNPTAFANFTVYFRSTGGWYGRSFAVSGRGWQTVELSRAEFRVEGQPAGWHDITGVRLSGWAGAQVDAFCMVDDLKAYRDRIVVLTDAGASTSDAEARAAAQYASGVVSLLRECGVRAGAMTETELLKDDLQDISLIILAYNPHASEAASQRLAEYVGAGGKVIVFYSISPVLAAALGVRSLGHLRSEYQGQFSSIRLDTSAATGLPEQVGQASWNIVAVELAGNGARVVGKWFDRDGKDTGYPAVILSDTGAYMSHVLLPDDPQNKARMLLALVGRLAPEAWEAAGREAAQMPAQVGHVPGDAILEWLTQHYADSAANADGRKLLAQARDLVGQTSAAEAAGDHVRAMELATTRNQALQGAYARAHKARPGEFRACWEHSGQGAYAGDWDKTMRVLAEAGFNAVSPNSFWGGSALYTSEILPVSPVVAEKGDQILAAVEAGRKYGVEVHPWKVNFWLGRGTPPDFIDTMRAQGRLQVSIAGKEGDWLCPSHPANQELEIASMVEVATKYDVDGVHFDYIRYPDGAHCYCQKCWRRFEEATGASIKNWPQDLRDAGLQESWSRWRAEQITHIVRETERRVHAVRPECKISAAVFSSYPNCYYGVGQDWVRWAKEGYVDFLCPMDYTNSDYAFAARVIRQLQQVGGSVPVYPGIGACSSSSNLTADRVAGQIAIARNLGTDGFIIFNYTAALGNDVLPDLTTGITSEKAYVPHHGPLFDFQISGKMHPTLWAVTLEPGQQTTCTIRPAADERGIAFMSFSGDVVLEAPDGEIIATLGRVSSQKAEMEVSFKGPNQGLCRIAIRGEVEVEGAGKRPFTARSMPLVFGSVAPDFALLTAPE